MERLGLIGGTGLLSFGATDVSNLRSLTLDSRSDIAVETEFGSVPITVLTLSAADEKREIFFLQRHHRDPDGSKIPHNIEHRGNVAAMAACDVDAVLAVCSVGGIADQFAPGMVALAVQYIDSSGVATSFHQDQAVFTSMSSPFDADINRMLLTTLRSTQPEYETLSDGQFQLTYWHGTGPQYETAAEVEMIRRLGGDCVGMTLGAEAKLMAEKGQRFSALLISSNYATGTNPNNPRAELDHLSISAQANKRLGPVWACISSLLG